MRKTGVFVAIAALLLLGLAAQAQEPGTITRVTVWKAKPGMEQKFEEGLKKHNDFHRKQNDTRTFETLSIMTGEGTGLYVRIIGGQNWADFDAEEKMGPADQADSAVNMDPYIESAHTSFYNYMKDVSRPAEGPAAMYVVRIYHVRYDKVDEFELARKKVHEAITKTNWPVHYEWYALVNGGDQPEFVLVIPHDNWADFKPPEKSFDKMLEEALGKDEAEAVEHMLDESIKGVSSEIDRYRADLSYVPAKKM